MTCPICDNKPPNRDCTELERRQHEEIERLTAEVERHRMTAEERLAVGTAVTEFALLGCASDDFRANGHIERARAFCAYLDRTAPAAES